MSFVFGGDTGISYDQLQRKREIADRLIAGQTRAPRNVGEGLTAVGNALMARSLTKKADKRDAELRGEFNDQWAGLFGGGAAMPATSGSFAAPSGGGYAASAGGAFQPPSEGQVVADDAMRALGKQPLQKQPMAQKIRAGLIERGLPEHVADGFIMNFQDESGMDPGINEIAPLVPGSRGGFGLYQLTGPRRREYEAFAAQRGVPVDDVEAQLDFLMTELSGSEARAAKHILSAPDAGSAAAAIVNKFLRPSEEHRARRAAQYMGGQGMPAQGGSFQPGQGTQTAQSGPINMQALAEVAGSPYASPGQKAVATALLQQQMQAMDPNTQLDFQLKQAQLANAQRQAAGTGERDTQFVDGVGLVDLQTGEVINDFGGMAGGEDQAEYGLTPQYGTRPDGTLTMIQLSKDGTAKEVDMPEGIALQKGVEKLDLGTSFQWYNTLTGEPIGEPIPKDTRAAAREAAAGSEEGKSEVAKASAGPEVIRKSTETAGLITSILNDPNLNSVVGKFQGRLDPEGMGGLAMGQGSIDVAIKIKQLQGRAFLEAFESLKGGGQITEREGLAAQAAMARLQRVQSKSAYRLALTELQAIANNAVRRARGEEVQEYTPQIAPSQQQQAQQPAALTDQGGAADGVPTFDPATRTWK